MQTIDFKTAIKLHPKVEGTKPIPNKRKELSGTMVPTRSQPIADMRVPISGAAAVAAKLLMLR